jgi:hypothetical protein
MNYLKVVGMECDNCICNLKICQAECCKQFTIMNNPDVKLEKGTIIRWEEKNDDLRYYFELHNGMIHHNWVLFALDNFEIKGNKVYVYERCKMLGNDNMCTVHNTDKQPKICQYPNKEHNGKDKGIFLTENCIFRRNKHEKKN